MTTLMAGIASAACALPRELHPQNGGDMGSRTPNLVDAIDALCQLSYIPKWWNHGDSNPDSLLARQTHYHCVMAPDWWTVRESNPD